MNQAVVRMYLLVLVGVLAVVLALWPKIPGLSGRVAALGRFLAVALAGLVGVYAAFHDAGRVDELRIGPELAYVKEVFPRRAFREVSWTVVDLETGETSRVAAPPEGLRVIGPRTPESIGRAREASGELAEEQPALRLPRSLKARLERPRSHDEEPLFVPVGPELYQPDSAHATARFAVVAAYEVVYRPETLFLARFEADGSPSWRIEAEALGLREGRLRRAAALEGGDLLLVLTGVAADLGPFEALTLDRHVFAARVDLKTGHVRWTTRF